MMKMQNINEGSELMSGVEESRTILETAAHELLDKARELREVPKPQLPVCMAVIKGAVAKESRIYRTNYLELELVITVKAAVNPTHKLFSQLEASTQEDIDLDDQESLDKLIDLALWVELDLEEYSNREHFKVTEFRPPSGKAVNVSS